MRFNRNSAEQLACLSEDTLDKSKKVLYMSHMAIGDYVYQGAFLKALAKKYPQLKIDLWIDDCRSKKKSWHAGRNTIMNQWLSSESYINYVYSMPESRAEQRQQIKAAWDRNYDVIVFVAKSRISDFASLALKIANTGKVFGTNTGNVFDNILNYSAYKKLDGKINIQNASKNDHITDFYQHIFQRFFGLQVPIDQRILKLNISPSLIDQSEKKLSRLASKYQLEKPKTIFINHLSTTSKRDWRLDQLESLALSINNNTPNSLIILNAPPHAFNMLNQWLENNQKLHSVAIEVFTAKQDFFELPALMSRCSLVISVETSIMHLASSLHIQQIALIRESAFHWRPRNNSMVLVGKKRVDTIQPETVLKTMRNL